MNGCLSSSGMVNRNSSQGFILKIDCLSKWLVMMSHHNIVLQFPGVIATASSFSEL
jgi:hypothetical protein